MRRAVIVLLVAAAVAACGGGDAGDATADAPTATPSDGQTSGPDGADAGEAPGEDDAADGPEAGADDGSAATPTAGPTPEPEPTATETPTPTATPAPVSCAPEVPLRLAIGQLLVPLATPGELADVAALAVEGRVGGVALLGAPTRRQLAALTTAADAGRPLLVSSDEEGGRVQRLGHLLGALPSAQALTSRPPAEVRALFRRYGAGLRDLGVAVAYAPVIDVGGGPGIGDRAFSSDPDVVARYGRAVLEGYLRAGVTPTLKHFPGHGSASADTHLGFATTPPLDAMRARDLVPWTQLLGDDDVAGSVMVMVGHLLVPGLTEDLPTSLSPAAIDGLLRDELGFDGVVITDALGMNAIAQRWSNPEAARLALLAGADLVILDTVAQVEPTIDHLVRAVRSGDLPRAAVDDSLTRTLALRGSDPCTLVRR